MNILYLYTDVINPMKGGVQRVTDVVSTRLRQRGHTVYFLGLVSGNSPYQFTFPNKQDACGDENLSYLKKFIYEHQINIAIFQEGISPLHSAWAYAVKDTSAKLVSCIHNSMLGGVVNMEQATRDRLNKFHLGMLAPLVRIPMVARLTKYTYCKLMHGHYIKLCNESDRVVLLSDKFIAELNEFVDAKRYQNICAIPNPVSFELSKPLAWDEKKKKILYVGRIDSKQKRVNLLLKIWEKVWKQLPDWSLDIVGDGPELPKLKEYALVHQLEDIHFYGFDNPKSYYESASIFTMTSSFEGFGIVLVEAMQYGVIPIAFNSYLSVTDIIDDGVNGLLVDAMDVDKYVEALVSLAHDKARRKRMGLAAIEKAKLFSIDSVVDKWEDLLFTIK